MRSASSVIIVVSPNPADGKVYSILHCATKFFSNLRQVANTPVSSTNKTERHDIAEILLNVALNFKNLSLNYIYVPLHYLMSMNCSLNVSSILT
jgi:hypothetical protein